MRLVLASQPVRNGDVAWNVRCMEDVLRACSGRADTVVFGESVLQGFDCLRWDYARDCTVAAAWTDEPVRHLQAAARENGAAVSFGMIERAADGLYSSQVFLGADGRLIDVFRRVSVGWKDVRRTDGHYREGDGFHLFSYGGIRFATALCELAAGRRATATEMAQKAIELDPKNREAIELQRFLSKEMEIRK